MAKYITVIVICIICFGAGYFLHKPKVVTNVVTKVEYKDRIVNKDTVIERKIYVATNGTVVTEEKEIIKDRIVEKEVIKEKEVNKSRQDYFLGLNVGYNLVYDPNILVTQTPTLNIENWTLGITLKILEQPIWVNYCHVHHGADIILVGVTIPLI